MVTDAPTQSTESKLHDVLNYIWATTGKIDPKKFKIGVDWDGWKDLGGTPKVLSLTFLSGCQTFDVVPVPGLPTGSVALIWR